MVSGRCQCVRYVLLVIARSAPVNDAKPVGGPRLLRRKAPGVFPRRQRIVPQGLCEAEGVGPEQALQVLQGQLVHSHSQHLAEPVEAGGP